MKIAWFSPFPPEKSAIAEYSITIIDELQKSCYVDLWIPVSDEEDVQIGDKYNGKYSIFNFIKNPEYINMLGSYDAIIYNIGNDLSFHKNIFEVLKLHPGIVILHDYVLHHFFAAYYLSKKTYIQEMEKNYGEKGKRLAEDILSGKTKAVWETDDVLSYPLNEDVINNATGLIVHSDFVKGMLKNRYEGLIQKLNFPSVPWKGRYMGKKNLNIAPDKISLLTFGEVNPNKRIDKVIEILGENKDLADKIIYFIVGREHKDSYDVNKFIEKFGLNDVVKVLGYQPKNILNSYISSADICINLRYPTMGESSWSLVQVLLAGKPAIVTRFGWYDELPDACVIKINPDREKEEMPFYLRELCNSRDILIEAGVRARRFAINNFSTEAYCSGLIDFMEKVREQQSEIVSNLIDEISRELCSMGADENSDIVNVAAKEIRNLANMRLDEDL